MTTASSPAIVVAEAQGHRVRLVHRPADPHVVLEVPEALVDHLGGRGAGIAVRGVDPAARAPHREGDVPLQDDGGPASACDEVPDRVRAHGRIVMGRSCS